MEANLSDWETRVRHCASSGSLHLKALASLTSAAVLKGTFPLFLLLHFFFLIMVSILVWKNRQAQTEKQKIQEQVSSCAGRGVITSYLHDEYPRGFGLQITYTAGGNSDTSPLMTQEQEK